MSENELLPCPFCGGEAEIYVTKHIPNGYDYTPRCKNTGCCGRLSKKFTSKDVAIAFWNKRKPMERIIDKIEDMKDDCLKEYNKYLDGEDLRKVILLGEAIEIVKEEGGIE